MQPVYTRYMYTTLGPYIKCKQTTHTQLGSLQFYLHCLYLHRNAFWIIERVNMACVHTPKSIQTISMHCIRIATNTYVTFWTAHNNRTLLLCICIYFTVFSPPPPSSSFRCMQTNQSNARCVQVCNKLCIIPWSHIYNHHHTVVVFFCIIIFFFYFTYQIRCVFSMAFICLRADFAVGRNRQTFLLTASMWFCQLCFCILCMCEIAFFPSHCIYMLHLFIFLFGFDFRFRIYKITFIVSTILPIELWIVVRTFSYCCCNFYASIFMQSIYCLVVGVFFFCMHHGLNWRSFSRRTAWG